MQDFADAVTPGLEQRKVLEHKSNVLRKTRDLLLPKLISGQLDVTDLDIEVPEDAA